MPVKNIDSKKKNYIKEASSADSAVLSSLVTHFFGTPPPLCDHSCLSQRLHSVSYYSAVIHKEMAFTAMYLQSYSIYTHQKCVAYCHFMSNKSSILRDDKIFPRTTYSI